MIISSVFACRGEIDHNERNNEENNEEINEEINEESVVPYMFYRGWRIVLVAVLACALGVNYTLFTWLNYEILGISSGKLSTGLQAWGYIVLLLGVLLLITLAVSKIINIKMIDKQLEIVMVLLFVLQLPMISLWFMALLMQGNEAIQGVVMHHILLGLALYHFLKYQYKSHKQATNHDDFDVST
jgi:hypothetical protein